MERIYTDEMIKWFRANAAYKSYRELTDEFNKRFDKNITIPKARSVCFEYKIKIGIKIRKSPTKKIFTPEIKAYMKENYIKIGSYAKLTEQINNVFNTSYSRQQIKTCARNNKLKLNLKSGKGSRNLLGAEWIDNDGYVRVKVSSIGKQLQKYKLKHVLIWEKANGLVPEGHCVIFADQNKTNFLLDNLVLVSRDELARLNKEKLIFNDKELTKTGVAIIRHKKAITNCIKKQSE